MQWSGQYKFQDQDFLNWIVKDESGVDSIAGIYKNYTNLTFLTVFNGGHMTPHDQPKNSLAFFTLFTQNKPFDTTTN